MYEWVSDPEQSMPQCIQHGGLATAAGAKDGHKFAVAELQINSFQRLYLSAAGRILFDNIFEFQHNCHSFESAYFNHYNRFILTLQRKENITFL